jgi:ferredoxin
MCQWCVTHGEGKKWYLNTKNYITKDLFDSKKEIQTGMDMYYKETERMFGIASKRLFPHRDKPIIGPIVRSLIRSVAEKRETGQVIPIEDAKLILNNANMAALTTCICRQSHYGYSKAKYCLPFTYLADYGKEWPDFSRGGINYISIEEAKETVEKAARSGLVISIFGMPVPFVSGMCMCEYPACHALKSRLDYGLDYAMRKAEYVVSQDLDECVGCGKCVGRCQFGAIKLVRTLGKAFFDIGKCFGCGNCTYVCEQKAISLVPREQMPFVRDEW